MTAKIINGRQIADEYLIRIKQKVAELPAPPIFAAVLVGDDPASKSYVTAKNWLVIKPALYQKLLNYLKQSTKLNCSASSMT